MGQIVIIRDRYRLLEDLPKPPDDLFKIKNNQDSPRKIKAYNSMLRLVRLADASRNKGARP